MSFAEQWRAWRRLRRCAVLDSTSREGSHVKVTGVVRALGETVIAPLSGRKGVVVRARVRAETGVDNNSTSHELLLIERFIVEHETTSCVIDGEHVVLAVPYTKLPRNNADRELSFLARHALKRGRASFSEQLVAPGQRVTVAGVLLYELRDEPPTDERTFREQVAPVPRLVGSDEHPLVIVKAR